MYFKFKGFSNCSFKFSSYDNGNLKLEVLDGRGTLLTILTEDMEKSLPKGYIAIRDFEGVSEFLRHLIRGEFISFFVPRIVNGVQIYICARNKLTRTGNPLTNIKGKRSMAYVL